MKTDVKVEVGRIGSGTGKPQGPEKRAPIPRRVILGLGKSMSLSKVSQRCC